MTTFAPTFIQHFTFGRDRIIVEIMDTSDRHAWRLIINNKTSPVESFYQGILKWKGWCLATDYYNGTFPAFVPFKIVEATP